MANRNYTQKVRTASGYDTLYPKTTAEQVITDTNNRFVSDAEKSIWSSMGRRSATKVIGNSNRGHLAAEVDYLCTGSPAELSSNLTAAIKSLPSSGGEILILEGEYNLANTVVVNKYNVIIRGCGGINSSLTGVTLSSNSIGSTSQPTSDYQDWRTEWTLIGNTAASREMPCLIKWEGSGGIIKNLTFKSNIGVNKQEKTINGRFYSGIVGESITLDNCMFKGLLWGASIYSRCNVINCVFDYNVYGLLYCGAGNSDSLICENYFSRNFLKALLLLDTHLMRISNNHFTRNGEYGSIINIKGCSIQIVGGGGVHLFVSNIFHRDHTEENAIIYVSHCTLTRANISANIFQCPSGAVIDGSMNKCVISGNTIYGGASTKGTISIRGGDNSINGNVIEGSTAVGNVGIALESGQNNIVSGNRCIANIPIKIGSAVSKCFVTGNSTYNDIINESATTNITNNFRTN